MFGPCTACVILCKCVCTWSTLCVCPLPPPKGGVWNYCHLLFLWDWLSCGLSCGMWCDVVHVWCGGSCYSNKLSLRYLTNSRSKKEVNSRTYRPWRFSLAKTKTGFGPLRSKRPAIDFLFATWIAQIPQRKSLVHSILSTKIILHTHLICVQTKIHRWHTDSLLIDSIEKVSILSMVSTVLPRTIDEEYLSPNWITITLKGYCYLSVEPKMKFA